MGYRNPTERGIRREWTHRLGVGGFPTEFGGLRTNGDRSSVPPNMFRDLINVRHQRNGGLTERPGCAKLGALTPGSSPVQGIYDPTISGGKGSVNDVVGGPRLFVLPQALQASIAFYSSMEAVGLQNATLSELSVPRQENALGTFRIHGTDPYSLSGTAFDRGASFLPRYVTDIIKCAPFSPPSAMGLQILIRIGTNIQALGTGLESLLGKLYVGIGTADISVQAACYVYSWDGTTLTLLETFTFTFPLPARGDQVAWPRIYAYREQLIVAYAGVGSNAGNYSFPNGSYVVRKRAYDGTWTAQTLPAGFAAANCGWHCDSGAVYKDVLYLGGRGISNPPDAPGAGHNPYILSYDGATWAVARETANLAGASGQMKVCVFGGYLYYAYTYYDSIGGTYSLRIGRFDGTTWTDNHHDFTASEGFGVGFTPLALDLAEFQGRLYLIAFNGNVTKTIFESNGLVTTSWVALVPTGTLATQADGKPQNILMSTR